MKNLITLLFLVLITTTSMYAQLEEGIYRYENDLVSLSFNSADNGWILSDVVVTNKKTGIIMTGAGEWFRVNMNAVDADYSGPEAWYQFETKECSYEFDEPSDKLVLREGCGTAEAKEYVLNRAH